MSKGIIVVDIPVICAECPRVEIRGNTLFCVEAAKKINSAKPKWCQIRPLPDRKPPSPYAPSPMLEKEGYYAPYDQGWNDCLDEIAIKSN